MRNFDKSWGEFNFRMIIGLLKWFKLVGVYHIYIFLFIFVGIYVLLILLF